MTEASQWWPTAEGQGRVGCGRTQPTLKGDGNVSCLSYGHLVAIHLSDSQTTCQVVTVKLVFKEELRDSKN